MSTFERPKTAHEAVLHELRSQLADGRIAPGSAVRPDNVGATLGVSAVPVREALRILEGEGHVYYRPHYGYVVTELDIGDLVEIYRIRELLEAEAVRVAVPKLTSTDVEYLHNVVKKMSAVENEVSTLIAVNREFHFAVFEAAKMPHLERVLRIMWDASDRYRTHYLATAENRALVRDQYGRILAAIGLGDSDLANKEMQLHRREFVAALRRLHSQSVSAEG